MGEFRKPFTTLRPCCMRYTILAFGSSLYIRYNTPAHVVNSTKNFSLVYFNHGNLMVEFLQQTLSLLRYVV